MLAKESIRTCLSCRKRALKADLIRVVWNAQKLCFDIPGNVRAKLLSNTKIAERLAHYSGVHYLGRGVYLHATLRCAGLSTGQRGKNVLLEANNWERGLRLERGTISADVMRCFLEELKILQGQILLGESQIDNRLEDMTSKKRASAVAEVLNAESKLSRSHNKQVPTTLVGARTGAKVRL